MASSEDTAQSIMAQAQALIEQVERDLAASDEEFRRLGIDPVQLRARLQAQMSDADQEQARQAVQADMDAVEQEVREEIARRSFAAPSGRTSPRRRPMI
ncbi:MAG: hypothetical protein ABWY08_04160 [Comamonas sp.]